MRIRQTTHRCGIVSFAETAFAFLRNDRAAMTRLAIVWDVSIEQAISPTVLPIIPPIENSSKRVLQKSPTFVIIAFTESIDSYQTFALRSIRKYTARNIFKD